MFESADHLFQGQTKDTPKGRPFKRREEDFRFEYELKLIFSVQHARTPREQVKPRVPASIPIIKNCNLAGMFRQNQGVHLV